MDRIVLLILPVLPMLTSACRRSQPPPPMERPNVLLIVADTLRADKLGCYGSALGLTPHLDALARESVRFERAFAHSPWTLPSVASLYTSTPPTIHGAGGGIREFRKLRDSARTIAECFRDAGYATGAVVNVDFLTAPFGMDQGFKPADFDFFAPPDNVTMRRAAATTDAALKWIRANRAGPFFCVVHYFDPHLVYDPPAEFRRRFAGPQDREPGGWVFGTREHVVELRHAHQPPDPETVQRAEKLYNGEVAYTDHEIGRLLKEVGALGLEASTLVVFTADHGEEFLDHGGFEHGHTLYDELLRAPLILRWPGKLPIRSVPAAVGQVDIAPTLCELAGIEPDAQFLGRSLMPLIRGEETRDRAILSHGNFWGPPLFGWRQGGYQLIQSPAGLELYRMETDPRQRDNLAAAQPETAQALLADMQLALKAAAARAGGQLVSGEPAPTLTREETARLRNLGYLGPE